MEALTDRLHDAYATLARLLPPAPLLRVRSRLGNELWLKCECLQPTGSFKIRGATYRLAKLTSAQRKAGVVAYSTGNHAQAVAKAASDLKVAATIVMSPDVPEAKVAATASWGAHIEMAEPTSAARMAKAEAIAHATGAILVPPYNDLDVIAGQASIAFELNAQLGTLKNVTIFAPIGGGSLASGVATAAKLLEPTARIIGVEPEWEADAQQSFREGRIVTAAAPSESIADAIKIQALGDLTFPLIKSYVDDIVTVSETEIREATLNLFDHHKLVVEPSGAIGYAAAKHASAAGKNVAVLCGGNVTLERLHALRASAPGHCP
jgi:threonine dehydratase